MTTETLFAISIKELTILLIALVSITSATVGVYWWFKSKYKELEIKLQALQIDLQQETTLISRMTDEKFINCMKDFNDKFTLIERDRSHCIKNNEQRFNGLSTLYTNFIAENREEHRAMISNLTEQTKAMNMMTIKLEQHLSFHKGSETVKKQTK